MKRDVGDGWVVLGTTSLGKQEHLCFECVRRCYDLFVCLFFLVGSAGHFNADDVMVFQENQQTGAGMKKK